MNTGIIRTLALICILTVTLSAKENKYMNDLKNDLRLIADTSSCVVGIAIKDLINNDEIMINGEEPFPTASVIKIPILMELYRQANNGTISLDAIRTLPPSMKVGGAGILSELGDNTVSMSLRDFAVCMMVQSDNAATNFIISIVGIDKINSLIAAEGIQGTRLLRVMMDMKAAANGKENLGTPKDFLRFLEKLYRKEFLTPEACDDMLGIMSIEKSPPSPIRRAIPSDIQLANKAGELNGIRCDAGLVFLANRPFIVSVMVKELMDDKLGDAIIKQVAELSFSYFDRVRSVSATGRR